MRFLILLLILTGLFKNSYGKNYIPIRIEKKPVIDGDLGDECWNNVEEVNFILIDGKSPKMKTTGMVIYDKENLYIGIKCYENQIEKMEKRFTNYDDPIWTDDCIEIFIANNYFNIGNYYHFVVNSIGTKFDQKVDISGFNSSWNGDWEAKTKIESNLWSVEVKIPFSTIDIKNVKYINLIGMSLCRERKTEIENSAWEIGGWFHKPEGHLLFTSYKDYLKKEILPLWEKEKKEIGKMLGLEIRSDLKEKMKKIFVEVEKNKNEIMAEKEIKSENINKFIEIIKNSLISLKILKEEAKFLYNVNKLKKIIGG